MHSIIWCTVHLCSLCSLSFECPEIYNSSLEWDASHVSCVCVVPRLGERVEENMETTRTVPHALLSLLVTGWFLVQWWTDQWSFLSVITSCLPHTCFNDDLRKMGIKLWLRSINRVTIFLYNFSITKTRYYEFHWFTNITVKRIVYAVHRRRARDLTPLTSKIQRL